MRIAKAIGTLFEERRNPQLNPRVDALSAFSMHKNKPNMFVTYTDLPKIGVNPRSHYDTPLGIYSYPLDYVLERAYREGTIYEVVPFAGDSEYVQLFQQTGNIVDVADRVDLTSEYMSDLFNDDLFLDNLEAFNSKRPQTVGQLWRWVYHILKNRNIPKQSLYTRKLFHDILGYDAISDMHGSGTIHMSEPVQAVHFTTRTIEPVEIFENKSNLVTEEAPYFKNVHKNINHIRSDINDLGDAIGNNFGNILNDIFDDYFEDPNSVSRIMRDHFLNHIESVIGKIGVLISLLSKAEGIPGVGYAFYTAHSEIWAVQKHPTEAWGRVVAIYAEIIDPNIYKVFQGIGETFFANPNNINWGAIRNAKSIFDRNFSPEMVKRMSDRVRSEI